MLVTTNVINRKPVFENPAYAREAIECLYRVQSLQPFILFGFVIMPDHCHFLLNVCENNSISKVMNAYKSGLTFDLGMPKLWQPRFHIRIIKNNIWGVLDYVHMNPVNAGLVETPEEYPWSSASGKWDVTSLNIQ